MKKGQVVLATVVAVHEYGIDIEAEGAPGFIQPIEVSWKPDIKPGDVVHTGDRIKVVIYAQTDARFFASIKRAQPELDPWRDPSQFRVGSTHRGVVTAVLDWGLKVRIADGVEGMLLTANVSREYPVGTQISIQVETVNVEQRKLSFRVAEETAS